MPNFCLTLCTVVDLAQFLIYLHVCTSVLIIFMLVLARSSIMVAVTLGNGSRETNESHIIIFI